MSRFSKREDKLPKHNHNLFFKSKFQPKDQIICPSYKPGGKKKSVDFYVSHDYAPKSISAGTVENIPYENARRDTEHSLYSFSAGVRIGYQISDKWTLQSGMNYSQINERFQYIDPESNQTREITIKDYIYQNGKIVDSVINTQTVTIPGDTQIKINNHYRTFDIPILGKYTILESKRFSISAVAGVYLNIVSATKGMILDNDGKSVINISESSDRKEVFKSNVGLSTFGALSIAYHISPSIDLFADPNARFQTRSITSETYPLSQRFNTYGLLTGVRYNF